MDSAQKTSYKGFRDENRKESITTKCYYELKFISIIFFFLMAVVEITAGCQQKLTVNLF